MDSEDVNPRKSLSQENRRILRFELRRWRARRDSTLKLGSLVYLAQKWGLGLNYAATEVAVGRSTNRLSRLVPDSDRHCGGYVSEKRQINGHVYAPVDR